LELLLQTDHVVIQKPPVQTFITYVLFFIQARRTGFAALKWQAISYERRWKYFTVILIIYFFVCFVWRLIWSRAGTLWRNGRLGISEAFCAA
jgi:hypothetical protein